MPRPADARPSADAAISDTPLAVAVNVPIKSPNFRSTSILTPCANCLKPLPALSAAFPIESKIPATPCNALSITPPTDSTTSETPSKIFLTCVPNSLISLVKLSKIGDI